MPEYEERHITFAVNDDRSPDYVPAATLGVDGSGIGVSVSGSGSIFSLLNAQGAKCRRIYAVFALPLPCSSLNPPFIVRKTPQFLTQILSQDFEEFSVAQLGTRKLAVNIGPFKLPEDEETDWELRSVASTTISSTSALSLDEKKQEYDDLYCVPGGFIRATDDEESDELIRKNHVEIAVGKGGMFTRSTYRCKQWVYAYGTDFLRADLVVFSFSLTNVDDATRASLDEPAVHAEWSAVNGISVTPDYSKHNNRCMLSSSMIILLESVYRNKSVIVMLDEDETDEESLCINPAFALLFESLRQVLRVEICSNMDEFLQTAQSIVASMSEKTDIAEIPQHLLDRVVQSDEEAVEWIHSFAECQT